MIWVSIYTGLSARARGLDVLAVQLTDLLALLVGRRPGLAVLRDPGDEPALPAGLRAVRLHPVEVGAAQERSELLVEVEPERDRTPVHEVLADRVDQPRRVVPASRLTVEDLRILRRHMALAKRAPRRRRRRHPHGRRAWISSGPVSSCISSSCIGGLFPRGAVGSCTGECGHSYLRLARFRRENVVMVTGWAGGLGRPGRARGPGRVPAEVLPAAALVRVLCRSADLQLTAGLERDHRALDRAQGHARLLRDRPHR